MLKKILLTFVLMLSLNANDSNLITEETQTEITTICDDKYDHCSAKCEESDLENIIKCNAKCEEIYQECDLKQNIEKN